MSFNRNKYLLRPLAPDGIDADSTFLTKKVSKERLVDEELNPRSGDIIESRDNCEQASIQAIAFTV
eukprot:8607050-Prorocentrum_lima.AAC.1